MYRTSDNFLLREIGGESILVPVGDAGVLSNSMTSMNETSSFLWKQFQTPHTLQEVTAEAMKIYSGPADVIEREIVEFTEAYVKAGLLKEESE